MLPSRCGPYRLRESIGKGNFAVVKLAVHEIARVQVAMKVVELCRLDADAKVKLQRELDVLRRLHHPHIIRLYECIVTDSYAYIVTEFITNGELFTRLVDHGKCTEPEARRLFRQITGALAYCHNKAVVHRDLKAENILLDRNDNAVLIDFGFSTRREKDKLLSTWCGSPPYAAPELHTAQPYDGAKADVWSLGVVLYILVSGGFPYPGNSVTSLRKAIFSGPPGIPFYVSVDCTDLIRQMLVIAPNKRYSIYQVTQHRWFTTASDYDDNTRYMVGDSLAGFDLDRQGNRITTTITEENAPSTLNQAIIYYMTSEGVGSKEAIYKSVAANQFDHLHGLYNLLVDKLAIQVDDPSYQTPINATSPLTRLNQVNRRGSITAGVSTPTTPQNHTMISVAELHKLKLNCVNTDSSDDDSNQGAASGSGDRNRRLTFDLPESGNSLTAPSQPPSSIRRHTLGPGTVGPVPAMSLTTPLGVTTTPVLNLPPPPAVTQYANVHHLVSPNENSNASMHMALLGNMLCHDTSHGHMASAAQPFPLTLYNQALLAQLNMQTSSPSTNTALYAQVQQLNELYSRALAQGDTDAWGRPTNATARNNNNRRASDGSVAIATHLTLLQDGGLGSSSSPQQTSPTPIEDEGALYVQRQRRRRTANDASVPGPVYGSGLSANQERRRRTHAGGSITQGTSARRASSPLQMISATQMGQLQTLHQQALQQQHQQSMARMQRDFEDLAATDKQYLPSTSRGPAVVQNRPSSPSTSSNGGQPLHMIEEHSDMDTTSTKLTNYYSASPNDVTGGSTSASLLFTQDVNDLIDCVRSAMTEKHLDMRDETVSPNGSTRRVSFESQNGITVEMDVRATVGVEGIASSLSIVQIGGCDDLQRCRSVVDELVTTLCAYPLAGRPVALS